MEKQATREAYGKTLVELGSLYTDVVVLDADLSKSTKTIEFARKYPDRFINAGIAEQNMMGMAAGLAASGKVVFASSFAVFATGRAFEQVRNSIAYSNLNVRICATHSGITVGEDGGSHQSVEDIALMRSLPNMKVIVPSDGISTREAVFELYKLKGPAYLRLGRPSVPVIYNKGIDFKIGRGIELRKGNDVTLIACGIMVEKSLKAAQLLAERNIDASVVDMHTIKPIDKELIIRKAKDTGAILCLEEHSVLGGLGSAVCETVCENCPIPVYRMGLNDVFGQSGDPEKLLQHYGLTVEQIILNVHKLLMNK